MWTAGAGAIQIEQVGNQLTPPPVVAPTDAPGTLAKKSLVYTPTARYPKPTSFDRLAALRGLAC